MGNTDSIPVISQTKSVVQLIAGDSEGAAKTQENFVKGCPVVSQAVALGAVIAGETEFAEESQKYFVKNMSDVANSIPVVGHAKGIVHYAVGDKEGGDEAMKSASRIVGIAAGGIGGFVVGGTVGAYAGGVAGGKAADRVISTTGTIVHDEPRPYGHMQSPGRLVDGEIDAGEGFDWALTPVFDGPAGRSYAKTHKNFKENRQYKRQIECAVEQGKITLENGQTASQLARQIQKAAKKLKIAVKNTDSSKLGNNVVGTMIIDVEGNSYIGYSFSLREGLKIEAFEGGTASVQQILREKFPGREPKIRGLKAGQPQCAEPHALHKFKKTNCMNATPKMTISIVYNGKSYAAAQRCQNCKRIGKWIQMGDVVTDAIGGTNVFFTDIALQTAVDLLTADCVNFCDCKYRSDDE